MPDDRNMSAAEYRGTVLAELRGIREKQEEFCSRLGHVECEIVGDVADPARPTIRGRLGALEKAVEADNDRRREERLREKARNRWILALVSGGLIGGFGLGWDALRKKFLGG